MPIYAYRCGTCGHAKDVLQKMSDAPLSTCPACGAEAFTKQVTAAGFQLKGSGWYVTDFRGGSGGSGGSTGAGAATGGANAPAAPSSGSTASGGSESAGGSASASPTSAGTPCGGSCACH